MSERPVQIVFVCGENACRSQIAEAFARRYGGDRVQAYSAGSTPRGQVDPIAIAVMEEKGVSMQTHASKGLAALPQQTWDVVVGMGCGDEACAVLPTKKRINWQIPDPAQHPIEIYRQVRDVINGAVQILIEQITGA